MCVQVITRPYRQEVVMSQCDILTFVSGTLLFGTPVGAGCRGSSGSVQNVVMSQCDILHGLILLLYYPKFSGKIFYKKTRGEDIGRRTTSQRVTLRHYDISHKTRKPAATSPDGGSKKGAPTRQNDEMSQCDFLTFRTRPDNPRQPVPTGV
jgi:hypothetical protein